jgi:hypothetical protein
MLNLVNNISIGGQTFNYVTHVEIESSWENLTDTATLELPRKIRFVKDGIVTTDIISGDAPLFKRGDYANIVIGYSGQSASRFVGYLSKVIPNNPLIFEFQDAMYLLKQKTIKAFSKENLTLTTLMNEILPPFSDSAGNLITVNINQDFTIGKYAIKSATIAAVLEHLKKNYGVTSYFRGSVLEMGLAYKLTSISELKIIEFDIEDRVIDNNLEFQRDDDQLIKVKAYSIQPDNTRLEAEAGDPEGGERTQYFYNLSQSDLQDRANERLSKLKYTGFAGSFTTFANPIVKHGDAVKLISTKQPDATGIYLVRSVVTSSGLGGGRQEIEIDTKIE